MLSPVARTAFISVSIVSFMTSLSADVAAFVWHKLAIFIQTLAHLYPGVMVWQEGVRGQWMEQRDPSS